MQSTASETKHILYIYTATCLSDAVCDASECVRSCARLCRSEQGFVFSSPVASASVRQYVPLTLFSHSLREALATTAERLAVGTAEGSQKSQCFLVAQHSVGGRGSMMVEVRCSTS